MGRLLCIDYGRKRSGLAVTDPLQICANGLPTQRSCDLLQFIKSYCEKEIVDAIIIGDPKKLNGEPSENAQYVNAFINSVKKALPEMEIIKFDERFTSSIAQQEMLAGGFKKKQRQEKGRVDEMAAILILTSFLERRQG